MPQISRGETLFFSEQRPGEGVGIPLYYLTIGAAGTGVERDSGRVASVAFAALLIASSKTTLRITRTHTWWGMTSAFHHHEPRTAAFTYPRSCICSSTVTAGHQERKN